MRFTGNYEESVEFMEWSSMVQSLAILNGTFILYHLGMAIYTCPPVCFLSCYMRRAVEEEGMEFVFGSVAWVLIESLSVSSTFCVAFAFCKHPE